MDLSLNRVTNVLTRFGSWREHFQIHPNGDTHKHTLLQDLPLFFSPKLSCLFCEIADGNAEASYWGIRIEEHRISSSIQEMMAGLNKILNRTRGEAGYKSIPSPNDDNHLDHIFSAHCCLDIWLSWGRLIHKTTHWSYVEVTFKTGECYRQI